MENRCRLQYTTDYCKAMTADRNEQRVTLPDRCFPRAFDKNIMRPSIELPRCIGASFFHALAKVSYFTAKNGETVLLKLRVRLARRLVSNE